MKRKIIVSIAICILIPLIVLQLKKELRQKRIEHDEAVAKSELMQIGIETIMYVDQNKSLPEHKDFFVQTKNGFIEYYIVERYKDEIIFLYDPKLKEKDITSETKILSFRNFTLFADGKVVQNKKDHNKKVD